MSTGHLRTKTSVGLLFITALLLASSWVAHRTGEQLAQDATAEAQKANWEARSEAFALLYRQALAGLHEAGLSADDLWHGAKDKPCPAIVEVDIITPTGALFHVQSMLGDASTIQMGDKTTTVWFAFDRLSCRALITLGDKPPVKVTSVDYDGQSTTSIVSMSAPSHYTPSGVEIRLVDVRHAEAP